MNYFHQESKRLRFRKLSLADMPSWTPFFVENDHLQYLGINLQLRPETQAHNWIEKQLERYEQQGFGHLAVELKDSREFIGVGGILPRMLHDKQEYEIAYSLIPAYWKRGYGTEIAQQMRAYGTAHINTPRLISIIHKENRGSIRVAIKNEMEVLFETTFHGMEVFVYGYPSFKFD